MALESVRAFVFSSTCAVYGDPIETPIPETHPRNPINSYGETKLAVERALPHFERAVGLRWVALRYFNAAGADPDGELGEDHAPEIHLIPRALEAAAGGPGLHVFGDDYATPDGTCLRDYVHVSDLADAHVKALEAVVETGRSGAYNLGTGRPHSVHDVIRTVEQVTGRPVPWTVAPRRAGDPAGLVRGLSEGSSRAALEAAMAGSRIDRSHGVGVAPSSSSRLQSNGAFVSAPNPLRRLFHYAKRYRSRLLWAVFGMLLYAAGSAGLAALIKPILDSVLPNQQQIAVIAWAIVGLYLVKGIGSYLSTYLMAGVGQRVVMDLRNALYRHILDQSAAFFSQRTTGQLMSRINNDVGQVQQVVSETAGDLARESLAIIGFAAILFYYDAWLALFCLISAPLIVYPLVRLGQRVRRTSRRSQEALEQLSHISAEAFTGHRIVKAFGTEAKEAEKFSRAGYVLYRTNMKVTAAVSTLPPLMELIGGLAMAGALWYGSREIAAGQLTTGEFTSFIAALFLMYGPAKKLSRVSANLQQAIRGRRADLRDARHPHRGDRAARGRAARAFPPRDRVPRRHVRIQRAARAHPARRVLHRAGRADDCDRRQERRRQDDPRQPAAAILRRDRRQHPHRRRRPPRRHARLPAGGRLAS